MTSIEWRALVVLPFAVNPWSPSDEARHPLRQAFHLPPCITPLSYEATTPDPLSSSPGGEGHLCSSLVLLNLGLTDAHAGRKNMTRKVFIGNLVLLLVVGIAQVSAQVFSIKLFDATPTFPSAVETSPDNAYIFKSTSQCLNFTAGAMAVLSSTPDGTGPIVVDNFMTINGVRNLCEGIPGPVFSAACFGALLQNPLDPAVIGMPIERVLAPIGPLDISSFLPLGEQNVSFDLQDFGTIGGNTDLWLVITSFTPPMCSVIPPPPPSPPDLAVAVGCGASGVAVVTFSNIGGEAVSGATKTVSLDRIGEVAPGRLFIDSTPLGNLNPGAEVSIEVPLEGCPAESSVAPEDSCRLFASVDQNVRTTPECAMQKKQGEVCEQDETNNSSGSEVTSGFCP